MIRDAHLRKPWVATIPQDRKSLAARIYVDLLELLLRRTLPSVGSRDLYQAMKSSGFSQSMALLAVTEYDTSRE